MRRPLVGITTYHRDGPERPAFSLPTPYVDALRAAGALPLLMPPGESRPAELLGAVDGIVFGGGGDLDPERYGRERHATNYSLCGERDAFELELMAGALEHGVPTLCICRGMQVLNLARGGTLHAHLPDVVGERVAHRVSPTQHTYHEVSLESGSRLCAVFAAERLRIASWHHQGVDRLGGGLTPVAWAEDGTVEALELAGHPALLAVQWHPELQLESDSPQHRLFRAFASLAASRHS